ncbi:MAG: cell division protein FtsW [Chloroflexi bacterium]|nr:cell division protein FtsW [Chloroflexota bacterium]
METDAQFAQPTARRLERPASGLTLGIDVWLLLAVFTLLVFGALMVYSASWDFSLFVNEGDPTATFRRQLTWMALGVTAAVVASFFDYHVYRRLALPLMGVAILGLITVFIIGEVRYNATRTLSGGSYSPSELAKVAMIIYLSVWLYSKREVLRDVSFGLVPLGFIVGIVSGLILGQPDLSAAATIVFLGGMLFFLAGGDLKQIFVLMALVALVGWVVVQVHPTGSDRIASYLQGIKDPTQADYHVRRSIEAFVNGGLFGVGIGNSDTKYTGLPVPPTDSIFAVVVEETGLVGGAFLVGLYLILLWRGLAIARRAPDLLGALLAAGLTLWIVMEAMINMSVMVGLMPFAGNALPFISVGGSNLMVTLGAVGILMNVARQGRAAEATAAPLPRRRTHAPDDLRRRERRRRVSRPGRSAGPE